MESTHQPMTAWYDPRRLLSIGIRVTEATVFGRMFDRRELIAALDPFDPAFFAENFDFTEQPAGSDNPQPRRYCDDNGDFWLDYAADTGDGWQSTHAVARLLARQQLEVDGNLLPQGRVLVFGGDEVYPTPSPDDYRERLQAPFRSANRVENVAAPAGVFDPSTGEFAGRCVFALPGNHDWYDGLTAFTHMFCNKAPDRPGASKSPARFVCGREARQTRSYFALKLPHDWWLCAFDAQLDGFIDAPQLRYFEFVAQNLMAPGSNVILCVAGPVWAYSRGGVAAEGFDNFAFASLIATGAVGRPGQRPERQHDLRLVLTGDSHHYAHFVERASDYAGAAGAPASNAVVHYLTCGLGGAFLHPTHWLEDTAPRVRWRPAPPLHRYDPALASNDERPRRFHIAADAGGQEMLFPDRATSRQMTWRNLAFGWWNPWFGAFLGGVGLFAAWLLHFGALVADTDLVGLLGRGSFATGARNLFWLLLDTPWPWVIIAATLAVLRYFADFADRPVIRSAIGALHAAAHVLIYCLLLLLLSRAVANDFRLSIAMGIATGLVSPFIMGVYLMLMLNYFGRHWNEAYSSLRIEDFKGFLRLKIDAAGALTVYPIVLDTIPRSDGGKLSPRLFEPPIRIAKTP